MELSAGTRLGSYEILSVLGAGGMGAVYRARDTKLNRDVAIKVLLPAVANHPERLARFRREAQMLAALNHPNIGQIYGLEEIGDSAALVLELIDGPTLADLIARGPVPLSDAVRIAGQVAHALEAAHEHGIVHRDLKPSNVKVRADGTVKVLDFGLAKAMEPPTPGGHDDLSQSPTLTSPAFTQAGMILGTAAYMAPEQASGKTVDRRSDLWAFGVVLMEMLTGRQVFTGETVSHVLAAVLTAAPDWSTLPADTPEPLRRLLRRCLERDRRKRIESAADAQLDLDDALNAPMVRLTADTKQRSPSWIAWSVAAGLAVAFVAALYVLGRRSPEPAPSEPIRFTVTSPSDGLLASAGAADAPPALSPDGRMIVFGFRADNSPTGRKLWVRRLDSLESKVLDGTDGASWPFWAPDSRSIAFVSDGQLKTIAPEGGQVKIICNARDTRGGTWGTQGVIVFTSTGRLMRVAAEGGEPSILREPDKTRSEIGLRSPWFLPDGRHLLFSAQVAGRRSSRLWVGSIDSSPPILLRDIDLNASYANGYVVFAEGQGRLSAQPFDAERLALTGDARVVANDFARTALTILHSHFSVAQNGVLEYQPVSIPQSELVVADRHGNAIRTIVDDGNTYIDPAISPNHRYLAVDRFDRATGDPKVWLIDLERNTSVPLSPGMADDAFPSWTRDSSAVMFSAPASDAWGLYRRTLNTSTGAELLLSVPAMITYPNDVSPDGRTLAYMTSVPDSANAFDIERLDIQSRKATTMFGGPGNQHHGRFSPDGKWIAYASDESGRFEVYVESTGTDKTRVVVSSGGGNVPRWRADGRELFYLTSDGRANTMYAVSVQDSSPPRFGSPVALFSNDRLGNWPAPTPNGTHYDVSPDGQTFVLVLRKNPSGQSPISVIVNWPSLLGK